MADRAAARGRARRRRRRARRRARAGVGGRRRASSARRSRPRFAARSPAARSPQAGDARPRGRASSSARPPRSTRCGALRHRDAAERELGRLGRRRAPPHARGPADGAGVDSLTERELEVARLIVDRRTNAADRRRAVPQPRRPSRPTSATCSTSSASPRASRSRARSSAPTAARARRPDRAPGGEIAVAVALLPAGADEDVEAVRADRGRAGSGRRGAAEARPRRPAPVLVHERIHSAPSLPRAKMSRRLASHVVAATPEDRPPPSGR